MTDELVSDIITTDEYGLYSDGWITKRKKDNKSGSSVPELAPGWKIVWCMERI